MKRNLLLVLCISLAVGDVHGQGYPQLRLIEEPSDVSLRQGGSVTLPCKVNGQVNTCLWMRDGTAVYIGSPGSPSPYQNLGDKQSGDCSLTIANTVSQDEGSWACQLPTPAGTLLSKSARITFVVPPEAPVIRFQDRDLSNEQTITVIRGQPAHLECISRKGKPASTLELIVDRNRETVQRFNRSSMGNPSLQDSLIIWNALAAKNPGQYEATCVAHHLGYPKSLNARVTVIVQQPTSGVQVQVNGAFVKEIELNAGEEAVHLTCVGDGFPVPEYEWLHRETEAAEWVRKQTGNSINVDNQHGGEYMCRTSISGGSVGPASLPLKVKTTVAVKSSNIGLVVGVVIACVVIITVAFILLIFMYRRKSCVFAPRGSKAQPDENRPLSSSDTEAAKPNEQFPAEETTIPAVTQSENLKEEEVNGKGVNGRNDIPTAKNPVEVVYAQLELDNVNRTAKIKTPEYEKTEYAEIQFKKDNQV